MLHLLLLVLVNTHVLLAMRRPVLFVPRRAQLHILRPLVPTIVAVVILVEGLVDQPGAGRRVLERGEHLGHLVLRCSSIKPVPLIVKPS